MPDLRARRCRRSRRGSARGSSSRHPMPASRPGRRSWASGCRAAVGVLGAHRAARTGGSPLTCRASGAAPPCSSHSRRRGWWRHPPVPHSRHVRDRRSPTPHRAGPPSSVVVELTGAPRAMSAPWFDAGDERVASGLPQRVEGRVVAVDGVGVMAVPVTVTVEVAPEHLQLGTTLSFVGDSYGIACGRGFGLPPARDERYPHRCAPVVAGVERCPAHRIR